MQTVARVCLGRRLQPAPPALPSATPPSLLCTILALYQGMRTTEERTDLSSHNSITCTGCAGSAPTFAVFCPHCDALLPPFTTVDPYKRTAAEEQIYTRTTRRPMNPIVVAGAWLMFCLTFLLAVVALAQATRDSKSYLGERLLYAILGCASATLATTFGYRVYRGFRRQPR